VTTFDSLGLSETLLHGVRAAGYDTPTPIQAQAIPAVLDGRDMVGCAQTGTGKTAAFVLPILDRLTRSKPSGGGRPQVRALIVTPTRELAVQIEENLRIYGKKTGLRSLTILGGVGIGPQTKALRQGVDILVATPGRLLDHLQQGNVSLDKVEILTLDEADRMLDMGFINDIRKIVRAVPRDRQTLLFSATMPKEIRTLADEILRNPEEVTIGRVRSTADTVEQRVVSVGSKGKLDLLVHVLRHEPVESVLVFARTKRRADRISKQLDKRGFSTAAMHGNRSQNQRQRALGAFDSGDIQILVATDVAARGIDVDNISHVINFDVPPKPEDYIHRIGRTGRAQSTGKALTFYDGEEADYIRRIEKHTGAPLERVAFEGVEVDEDAPSLPGGQPRSAARVKAQDGGSSGGSRSGGGGRSGGNRRKRSGGGRTQPNASGDAAGSGSASSGSRRRKRSGGAGQSKSSGSSGSAVNSGGSSSGESIGSREASKGRRPNFNARRG
jgi:ATP-dependent RNA helicase RhlE